MVLTGGDQDRDQNVHRYYRSADGVYADVEPDENREGDDGDQQNVEHHPDRGDCLILPPFCPHKTRLNRYTELSKTFN